MATLAIVGVRLELMATRFTAEREEMTFRVSRRAHMTKMKKSGKVPQWVFDQRRAELKAESEEMLTDFFAIGDKLVEMDRNKAEMERLGALLKGTKRPKKVKPTVVEVTALDGTGVTGTIDTQTFVIRTKSKRLRQVWEEFLCNGYPERGGFKRGKKFLETVEHKPVTTESLPKALMALRPYGYLYSKPRENEPESY